MSRLGSKGKVMSTRALLRAFQVTHREGVSGDFKIDLDLLRHKDLDLSVRLGALLAFDALLITAGINPITSSPGAPLSINAVQHPVETVATMVGVLLVAVSAAIVVRAITLGEEFSDDGIEDDPQAITRRMFAAFCVSIDVQTAQLKRSSFYTLIGGAVIATTFVWILADKILG